MAKAQISDKIIEKMTDKSCMKQDIYKLTLQTFTLLKEISRDICEDAKKKMAKVSKDIDISFTDKGTFEAELKLAGDLIVLTMHSNVFEFPREHDVMKTPYIKEDPKRSYCGIINIYNFLSDSFKYNRTQDVGYLVARIFINKELHFMVEGKRQIGLLYNNFVKEKINAENLQRVLESALIYCLDFDLLVQPYDNIKEVSVAEMQQNSFNMSTKTGKRLGFRFQIDKDDFQ